jgi:hypothetical protein
MTDGCTSPNKMTETVDIWSVVRATRIRREKLVGRCAEICANAAWASTFASFSNSVQ